MCCLQHTVLGSFVTRAATIRSTFFTNTCRRGDRRGASSSECGAACGPVPGPPACLFFAIASAPKEDSTRTCNSTIVKQMTS